MGRVAFAEAGNQGAEGLAGVIFTILNRLHGGNWGATVPAVVDAPGQFEPVTRAGGTWTKLPALTPGQAVEDDTILHLILQGRVPDPTNGALYFQNPAIVAQRAAAGEVSGSLVNFGGDIPSATIRDQAFYRRIITGGGGGSMTRALPPPPASLFAQGSATGLFAPDQGEAATPAGLFVPVERRPLETATLPSRPAGSEPTDGRPQLRAARQAGLLPAGQAAPAQGLARPPGQ